MNLFRRIFNWKIAHAIWFIFISSVILSCVVLWFIIEINSQKNLIETTKTNYDNVIILENKLDEINKKINTPGSQRSLYNDYIKAIKEEQVAIKKYLSTQKSLQSKIYYKYIPEHKKALAVGINHINDIINQNEAIIVWAQEAAKEAPDDIKLNNLLQEVNKKVLIANTSFIKNEKEAQKNYERETIGRVWVIKNILAPIFILITFLFVTSFLLLLKTKSKVIPVLSILLEVFNLIGIIFLSSMIFL